MALGPMASPPSLGSARPRASPAARRAQEPRWMCGELRNALCARDTSLTRTPALQDRANAPGVRGTCAARSRSSCWASMRSSAWSTAPTLAPRRARTCACSASASASASGGHGCCGPLRSMTCRHSRLGLKALLKAVCKLFNCHCPAARAALYGEDSFPRSSVSGEAPPWLDSPSRES